MQLMQLGKAWSFSRRIWLPACAFLNVLPLFATRHLPWFDLPEHVATIATLRHFGSPLMQREYEVAFGRAAYFLYHLVCAALSFVVGSAERANLLAVASIGMTIPFALASLLRALRQDERAAVYAVPFFWSQSLASGFLSYLASIPVAMVGIAQAIRHAETPTRKRGAGLAVLHTCIALIHPQGWAVFVIGALAACVASTMPSPGERGAPWMTRARALAVRSWWFVPGAVIIVAVRGGHLMGPDVGPAMHLPTEFFVRRIVDSLWDVFRSPIDDRCGAIALGLLLFHVALSTDKLRSELRSRLFVCLVLVLAIGGMCFALPSSVGILVDVGPRMMLMLVLFLPILVRVTDGRLPRALYALAALNALVVAGHAAYQLHRFDAEEGRDMDAVLADARPGKRLLGLMFRPDSPRMVLAPFILAPSFYRAQFLGTADFSYAALPFWPVQYRDPQKRWAYGRNLRAWDPCAFRNATDGPHYDYVLVRGAVDPFARAPRGPRWRLVSARRDWKLYEREAGEFQGPDAMPCQPAGG